MAGQEEGSQKNWKERNIVTIKTMLQFSSPPFLPINVRPEGMQGGGNGAAAWVTHRL